MADTETAQPVTTEKLVNDILASIDREREREIVARRFGLFDRKETLEQIGEMLGIAPGTCKSQLFKARARMRELLGSRASAMEGEETCVI